VSRQGSGRTRTVSARPYSSTVRSDQARGTRRVIVAAATELFVAQGFAATTVDAVAERAGVSRKTVFASIGSKSALLKLAWDHALAGDDEPVPMSQRPAVRAIVAERDPRRLVSMWTDLVLDVGARAMSIGTVVLAAADVDPEARALRDAIRRESLDGATAFVTHLAETGGLRVGLSVARAADACWALVNSLMQHLLTTERGWSTAEYGEWLARVVSTTLLDADESPAQPPPGVSVQHRPEAGVYQATVGGALVGRLTYETGPRVVVLLHTEVDDGHEDAADPLVRRVLDDVRAAGTHTVVPVCPYVRWWIARHPDEEALLHDPRSGRSNSGMP
jgi:AcrR family transcriptional regulator